MSTAAQQSDALPGDDFVPSDDGQTLPGDDANQQSLADAGNQTEENAGNGESVDGAKADGEPPQYDADTLALIAGDEKPATIPHARFNEVNTARKAAEARTRELELQLARLEGKSEGSTSAKTEPEPPKLYDFDDAEERYAAALLDGESAKARQIRSEIRAEERKAAVAEAEQVADRRYKQNRDQDEAARTKLQFEIELNKTYTAYPFLNVESPDANPEAIEEALVWTKFYQQQGKTPAESLSAAAAKIGARYVKPAPQAQATSPKPDLQKGVDRANVIPPKATGLGARSHKVDVMKMTSEEFRNMSPEDKARFEEGV